MERIAKKLSIEEFKKVMLDKAFDIMLKEKDVENREEFDELDNKMGIAAQRWYECGDPMGYIYQRRHGNNDMIIIEDLLEVDFDCENTYSDPNDPGAEFQSIENFHFLGVYAGGDWETPVYYILYIDNEDKIRGYIPTEGNVFNTKSKSAFGNNEGEDEEQVKIQFGIEGVIDLFDLDLSKYFNWDKVKEDIAKNIKVQL